MKENMMLEGGKVMKKRTVLPALAFSLAVVLTVGCQGFSGETGTGQERGAGQSEEMQGETWRKVQEGEQTGRAQIIKESPSDEKSWEYFTYSLSGNMAVIDKTLYYISDLDMALMKVDLTVDSPEAEPVGYGEIVAVKAGGDILYMVRDDGCLILYDTVCQTEISTLFPGYQIPMEDTSDICLCTADDTGVYFTVDERKFMHVKSDGSVEELRGFDEPQTVRLAAVDGSVFYYDKWAEDGRYDTGTPYYLWNGRILFSSGGFLYSVNVDDTGDEKSTEISGNNCTLMGEYIYYVDSGDRGLYTVDLSTMETKKADDSYHAWGGVMVAVGDSLLIHRTEARDVNAMSQGEWEEKIYYFSPEDL